MSLRRVDKTCPRRNLLVPEKHHQRFSLYELTSHTMNHNVLVEIEGNGPNWRGWELKRREASHMACPLSTLNSTFFNPTHNLNLDLTKENYYFFLLNNVAPCPLTGKTADVLTGQNFLELAHGPLDWANTTLTWTTHVALLIGCVGPSPPKIATFIY